MTSASAITEPPIPPPPASGNGTLTVNGQSGTVYALVISGSISSKADLNTANYVAVGLGPAGGVPLFDGTGNRFSKSDTFAVVVTKGGETKYKTGVSFTAGSAAVDWGTELQALPDTPVVVPPAPTHPAGVYVSAAGSDGNPGTYDYPLRNLNTAVNRAAITDHKTVYVKGTLTGDEKAEGGMGYSLFVVINKAQPASTVTIKGIDNGKLQGGGKPLYRVLEIKTSSIRIEDLTITGGACGWWGGGIFAWNNSTLSLGDGALITKNAAKGSGGGVQVYDYSALYMEKGSEVSYNTANDMGGGVYVQAHSRADIRAGSLIGHNAAEDHGGGMYVYDKSSATINGGIIEYNKTDDKADGGGGISLYLNSEVTLNSGEIRHNESVNDGGGVYVHNYATLTMTGGSIHSNTTEETGGGVCLAWSQSKFRMSGGEIYLNKTIGSGSLCSGGGVAREVDGTQLFIKTGGVIYGSDNPDKANMSGRGFSHTYAFHEAANKNKPGEDWSDSTLYGSLTK
jgi:hypothetical protein